MPKDPINPNPRWHTRGYIPHANFPGLIQSITFRQADSLPQTLLQDLKQELATTSPQKLPLIRRQKIETLLDAGYGSCALQNPEIAQLTQDTLKKFHGTRYQLLEWCIMPNHIHVLIKAESDLPKIIQSWKSYTGRYALQNSERLNLKIPGPTFWQREYWDRYIRNQDHYESTVAYIHNNPVKANLCKTPKDWNFSSAH